MEFRLNLASRVYLDRRSVRRWLCLTVGVMALVLTASLLYVWRNMEQLQLADSRLAEIDARLTAQRGQRASAYTPEAFTRVMGEVAAANQIIVADQFRWTALLGRFEALLPDDVAIRSLQPNYRDRSLQINPVARNTLAMSKLLDALLGSPDMNQAFLLNQVENEQNDGRSAVQFSILIREAF